MEHIHEIVNNMINNAIIVTDCTICQNNIFINDNYYTFCCNQKYHEECLSTYIWLNDKPKCPICHKLILKNVKKDFDYIFDVKYKLKYVTNKLKNIKSFTETQSRHLTSPVNEPSIEINPELSETEMDLNFPTSPRNSLSYHLFNRFRLPSNNIFWHY
jgi:endogenous inhibitor of DNA gyrase (YacG/DUF329 family)